MTRAALPPARVLATGGLRTPVAVVGAAGMLGRAVRSLLAARSLPHRAFTRAELDICDPAAVATLANFPIVINCAAWTDVDGAEADEAGATRLNAHAVGVLAAHCRSHNSTRVHYGTDYVFSGVATEPYPIDAPIAPLNAYGRSKAAGESVLSQHVTDGLRLLYMRTSWLYAPWGKNFVRTIAAASAARPQLKVVDDQRGRPTSSLHLARCTLDLLNAGAEGTTHITDSGECSWYGFAREIVTLLGRACDVVPCTTKDFPRPATRPPYSVLDLSNAQSILGRRLTTWQENLAETLRAIE